MVRVFFSYSHKDEDLRDQLEVQLTMLKRQGLIEAWHDRRIGAGTEFGGEIDSQIESSNIVLLLVSSDFLASDYCYDKEMLRAMELHEQGALRVIPVILRPCEWEEAPFGKLQATPVDGRPVTSWPDRDSAFLEISKSIRKVAKELSPSPKPEFKADRLQTLVNGETIDRPRSSNLRVAKEFSERDRDRFKVESFEYMARFFENSLKELEKRNDGIECDFRRVDANRFTASIYRHGNAEARCTIFMGGQQYLGQGIAFIHGETSDSNGYNEALAVSSDNIEMFLVPSGMAAAFQGREEQKLTQMGASEFYWSLLMRSLKD
ncbi:toll/interleukin-1 receptor domain-containing protein [uncultured Erythrobacter sp.]|uniref:toll/interleukin-1 receptor domain-containing protein n=1 Tax=uncultured Erythrobacter sp. TaxID=263913 RepID=UPI0026261D74|nr:toll/interleukin-1 receptor domain-containing protein [uncultured Erythrobacter sp.]